MEINNNNNSVWCTSVSVSVCVCGVHLLPGFVWIVCECVVLWCVHVCVDCSFAFGLCLFVCGVHLSPGFVWIVYECVVLGAYFCVLYCVVYICHATRFCLDYLTAVILCWRS